MEAYIRSMQMPKNHNHVTITIWSNGVASYALHDRGESLVDFRNVEVVTVPPHGRLIDADLLQKSVPNFGFGYRGIMQGVIGVAPTIVPASGKDTDAPTREEGE